MLFLLASPEYNNVQSNTTKVRVHLRTGIAEIFDQHQDLMGKVENNIVEVESNFENKSEKFVFILQDAVFIVSNKGLDTDSEQQETSVYVYAKKVREVNSSVSIDEITKEYEAKQLQLENEIAKLPEKETKLTSKIILLQDDTEFLKKSLGIIKSLKK
jgi:F0F1-type ATP synthase epsilon subunit